MGERGRNDGIPGASFSRWAVAATVAVLVLAAPPLHGQTGLLGPFRIRDMTPFNILRLDLRPAWAARPEEGTWAIEATATQSNTFVMSDNVRDYLEARAESRPLDQADVETLFALAEDVYFVDGEFGVLDLTVHYAFSEDWALYFTLPLYYLQGGSSDGWIESVHDALGFSNANRDLVARDSFQLVTSLEGIELQLLDTPFESGLGDPVVGFRRSWQEVWSGWDLVLEGAAKIAAQSERRFRSTGSNDYGVQAAFQHKADHHGFYLSGSWIYMGGRVLGVDIGERVIPAVMAAYERSIGRRSSFVLQLNAARSAIRHTAISDIEDDKIQATLGVRSRRGNLLYGLALTENLVNFENTPDVGVSLTLGWLSRVPDR